MGTKTGKVVILSAENLNKILKIICDRKSSRQCCSFSPSGEFLAVGSVDSNVDIYDVHNGYKHIGTGNKNSAGVLQLDWTNNSEFLSACDVAGERLIYEASGIGCSHKILLEWFFVRIWILVQIVEIFGQS